ncbi:MAG: PIN domain-containing protein [Acidobacteria bacterium]|nr:PIN domain-containing protein [Acidobacteriota bacterium]
MERLVAKCRILDITAATADVYARLRLTLKTKGKPIPENDLWIAALCVEHQVKLAAVDGHFDAIDGLQRFEF